MSGNVECPFLVWGLIAFLGLALVISLIFNISHYVEKKHQGKMRRYSNDCIHRDDDYYVEDIPIYGNLDNVVPEPTDENCYEQMKAQPERSATKWQDASPSKQAVADMQMCYASLNHSCKGKFRKPRKQDASVPHKDEDKQCDAMDTSISKATLVDSLSPESQAIEENIHDDPIRLFGLIRAKKDPVH